MGNLHIQNITLPYINYQTNGGDHKAFRKAASLSVL